MTKPELDLATTRNPWGTIPQAGGQWPEARSFTRMYGFNPLDQVALIDTLISLHQTALRYTPPNQPPAELELPVPDKQLAARGIARTLWYVGHEEPDWLRKKPDASAPNNGSSANKKYKVDPTILAEYEAVLAGQQIATSEQRTANFLRIYERNPYATSNLLQTLVGMYKKPWEGWCGNERTGLLPIADKDLSLQLSRRGIAQSIWYLASAFPEWAQDGYLPTPAMETFDDFLPYTNRDGRLRNFAHWIPNEEPELQTIIEQEMVTYG